jgi:hypothetical protein
MAMTANKLHFPVLAERVIGTPAKFAIRMITIMKRARIMSRMDLELIRAGADISRSTSISLLSSGFLLCEWLHISNYLLAETWLVLHFRSIEAGEHCREL